MFTIKHNINFSFPSEVKSLCRLDKNLLIAGGAIRDIINDIPVKDYDIFIIDKDTRSMFLIINEYSKLYPDAVISHEEANEKSILDIWKISNNEILIDVINVRVNINKDLLLDSFDFNVNKVIYDTHTKSLLSTNKDILNVIRERKVYFEYQFRIFGIKPSRLIRRIKRLSDKDYIFTKESLIEIASYMKGEF